VTIDERIAKVKSQFAELNENLGVLMEKRGEMDRQIQGIKDEQIRLQGEYRLLEVMKNEPTEETTH
jgi:uncharacterized protein (DUF3084 family)